MIECPICKNKNQKTIMSYGDFIKIGTKITRHYRCLRCNRVFAITNKPIKIRKIWNRNPQTQIKKSNKIYNRRKAKRKFKKRLKGE